MDMNLESLDVYSLFIFGFQHGNKRALREHSGAHLSSSFSFLLLFKKFALPADVPAIAFGRYIFSEGRNGRTRDYLSADCALNGDFETVSGYFLLKTVADLHTPLPRTFTVHNDRKGVNPSEFTRISSFTRSLCRYSISS